MPTTDYTDSNSAPSISKDASTSKNMIQEAGIQTFPLDLSILGGLEVVNLREVINASLVEYMYLVEVSHSLAQSMPLRAGAGTVAGIQ
ncbi:hypothetical protein [Wolbachia pipientis]|uniref:hypothetical protein n=1 Tax=Wolbachia pipientis TaxID=955 RepID=UPI0025A38182|nr:hypothetical protein [Wolbachia pipientis]MDM8335612.1 hypothetical protein [Wolbachia pipientis]